MIPLSSLRDIQALQQEKHSIKPLIELLEKNNVYCGFLDAGTSMKDYSLMRALKTEHAAAMLATAKNGAVSYLMLQLKRIDEQLTDFGIDPNK